MEDFHWPSFLIDCENILTRHGCVTASQIENTRAAILIVKDLAHEAQEKTRL